MKSSVSDPASPAIHVFVQYYRPDSEARRIEVNACLRQNLANRFIDRLHVWVEKAADLAEIPELDCVETRVLNRRMTFADWLEATNSLSVGTISLLINADIFLDESLGELRIYASFLASEKVFLALTRYNREGEHWALNPDPHWTQDAWGLVRRPDAIEGPLLQEAAIHLGIPGCDNKIAYLMHSYGFSVSNPCHRVKVFHLHAETARGYHNINDRLLGLYAFVEPVSLIGAPSALELHLLTRATQDPAHITVANWLNQRDNQFLEASPVPTRAKSREPRWGGSRLEAQRTDPRFLTNVPREYVTVPDERDWVGVESFSSRYACERDAGFFYFIDHGWPSCARICVSDMPEDFASWPAHKRFALGFLPPLIDLAPFSLCPADEVDVTGFFWQHPCRTEQAAAEAVERLAGYLTSPGHYDSYLGLPWATFYDRALVAERSDPELDPPSAFIEVLAARLGALRGCLGELGSSLRLHTVCQHIDWMRCIPWFKRLGITDLWISHKQGGLDDIDGIRLHPWHLYAVNVLEKSRQRRLCFKPVEQKSLLASFVGAHMPHYLGEVRPQLAALLRVPDILIALNDQWHFNRSVYENQVVGEPVMQTADEFSAMERYNDTLSDSRFSLCPAGSGPNTLRLWESLAIGSVPVVLSDTHELPSLEDIAPSLGLEWEDVLIRYPEGHLGQLEAFLRAVPDSTAADMQRNGIRVLDRVLSSTPLDFVDGEVDDTQETLSWFKYQQLHGPEEMPAVITARSNRICAWLPEGQAELRLHFDQPEELLAIRVFRSGDVTAPVEVALDLATGWGKFVEVLRLEVASERHWISIPDLPNGRPLLTETIRIRRAPSAKPVLLRFEFKVQRDRLARELREIDARGGLQQAWSEPSLRARRLFDAQYLENGEILRILRAQGASDTRAETEVLFPDFEPPRRNLLGEVVGEGNSLVVALMNRNALVERNIKNWLSQSIDELLLIDWSSSVPVASLMGIFDDPRVRVIRVPDQTAFTRTWAQNLGIRCARNSKIMKCDADVSFHGDFFQAHPLSEHRFWVGDWRHARDWNERHLNGNIYAFRRDFLRVNGYDERITTYGHDDSDLTWRLILAGCRKQVLAYTMMHHQPHPNTSRIERNEGYIHPEVLTRYQRLLASERMLWSPASGFCFEVLKNSGQGQRIELEISSSFEAPQSADLLAEARRTVASWYAGPRGPEGLSEAEIDSILSANLG